MSGSVNKATILGRLGADPEVRTTGNGKPVVNLRVATSERWKDKQTGEQRENTTWHRVVIFSDGLCRVAENFLKKGSKIYLEGQIQNRVYQDKEGADQHISEIVLQGFNSSLILLDSRDNNSSDPATQQQMQQVHRIGGDVSDSMPF